MDKRAQNRYKNFYGHKNIKQPGPPGKGFHMWNCMRLAALLTLLTTMLPAAAAAEDNGMTARGIFSMLPVSIFENTVEGLSEADKQRLLTEGHSDFWEIAGET